MADACGFAGFLDPVAVVPGAFHRAGRCVRGGPGSAGLRSGPGGWGVVQPSPQGGMSAVPVAVRRIRRRAWAKEIESGSRSAAAEAFAVSALIAWWTIR